MNRYRRGGFGGGGRSYGGGRGGGSFGGGGRGSSGVRGGGGTFGGSRGGSFGGGAPRPSGGGIGGGLGGARRPAPRHVPRRRGGFGMGMGLGMGLGMGMGMRRRRFGWGWGRRNTVVVNGGGGGGCGGGFLMIIVMAIVLMATVTLLSNLPGGGGGSYQGQVISSTTVREALPLGNALSTAPLFTDNMGWVENRTAMERGLNNFYRATGVRPHIYLVNDIPGSEGLEGQELIAFLHDNLPAFSQNLYTQLFGDNEYHLLLVFFYHAEDWEPLPWRAYAVTGIRTNQVIDQEALDILFGFIDFFYAERGITPETMFSNAFDRTATRIMEQPTNILRTLVVGVTIVAVLFILFTWWKRKQEQKNLEAEQNERILNQPLETFGTETRDAANSLAEKYENNQEN